MSNELLENYNQGFYNDALEQISDYIHQIIQLNIEYPAGSNPIFYMYIVPDSNFAELLQFPFAKATGGGRPMPTCDLDGFHLAYGISNNILENRKDTNMMQRINAIHEFSHLVHSMFFDRDQYLSEGFSEALPLYTLKYEELFDEHRLALSMLDENQILTAQELIHLSQNSQFRTGPILPNKSCSFNFSYISSYLFVRGCLELIADKYSLDRAEATQKFLEIVYYSSNSREELVYDIANELNIPCESLLNEKNYK